MLGVSVRALRRQAVGESENFQLTATPDDLPEIGLHDAVQIDGRVTNLGSEGFLVNLSGDAALERECARCLTPVRHEMHIEAEDTFAKGAEQESGDEVLDLEPLIREALVLEEPIRVLCRADCLGLCDRCGKDLNEGPCECDPGVPDPRFEALRRLVQDREENR